jgi:hypothetical protein
MEVGVVFTDNSSGKFKITHTTSFKAKKLYTIEFVKRPLQGEMTIANPKYALSFNEFTIHESKFNEMLDLDIIKIV